MTRIRQPQQADGLYDERYEHDACGVAVVARLDNIPSHEVVRLGIEAVANLEHRGAAGADPETGDGAGLLLQMPDEFLREIAGFELPPAGSYGVAMCFLPTDSAEQSELTALLERITLEEGQRVLGWRDVPTDDRRIGPTARASQPTIRQLFIGAGPAHDTDQDAFERKLYVIRRLAEKAFEDRMYIASCSSRTVVYKGMLIAYQLDYFYRDLSDERMASTFVLVHSRFSTNTFPSWELAHPYRMIAHNGEINTLQGNVNWMRARESQMASELFGEDLAKVLPVVRPGGSDSATFDNVLELLTLAGRSLPHAAMMMIPEAYRGRDGELPPELGGFYADLADKRMSTALALVHSRFSTNTFPSWELAHPYRMIAHNGEINTLQGNVNWMRARESQMASELFGDDLAKVLPVVRPGGSDSATFDNVL
ncbi:MAG TPA: hypothetical protein VKS25_12335, partial [Solirubrobacteraceae bacterium]|nr:hypothetical protein [Solirubrobacteraceae bacterium]